ncbi:uncharacterized protein [Physcomitrium patens]|uniref:uncharacterized protein n=1 Tax=Physcomitrium patens TaxID=3218 RepID=UPI003CCE0215
MKNPLEENRVLLLLLTRLLRMSSRNELFVFDPAGDLESSSLPWFSLKQPCTASWDIRDPSNDQIHLAVRLNKLGKLQRYASWLHNTKICVILRERNEDSTQMT